MPREVTARALRLASVVLAATAWGSTSHARELLPDCHPLDETALRALVSDAIAQVERGDPEGQQDLATQLVEQLPCLTVAPSRRLLAQVFVLRAIDRYLAARIDAGDAPGRPGLDDWKEPIEAAVRLHPRVDRLVGNQHPIFEYEVPARAVGGGRAVPPDVAVYVDGERVDTLPPTGELHLVQVRQGDRWRSGLFTKPVPERWMTDRIRPPRGWSWWGNAAFVLGGGGLVQRPGWDTPDDQVPFAPTRSLVMAWPGVAGRMSLRYGAVGVFVEVEAATLDFELPFGTHGHAAVVYGRTPLQVGIGAGAGGTLALDTDTPAGPDASQDYDLRTQTVGYWLGTAQYNRRSVDLGLSAGRNRGLSRANLAVGWMPDLDLDALPIRLGLSGVVQRAALRPDVLEGEPEPVERVQAITWRVGAEIGVRIAPSK